MHNRMNETIVNIEKKIIEEFEIFDDWMDKYSHIIELGNNLPDISPEYKKDNYIIKGCQSLVWLYAEYKNKKVFYYADSDGQITKGIISLLIRVLSGNTPDEIINAQLNFIEQIGLKEHLSPTRNNGLLAMIKQMKLYAMAFKLSEK